MGFGFELFEVLFTLSFVAVFGIFIVVGVKSLRQWNKNNHSPRLSVPATVITKRTNVTYNNTGHHTSTTYYVTFQVESGDRMELRVEGAEYGLLMEGDRGSLTFQGTRYLGFDRT